MHFYSISYNELLDLPIYLFWELSKNIGRLQAEQDLRLFRLLQNIIGGNPKEYINDLVKERGNIIVGDDYTFDKQGLNRLRVLFTGKGK